MNAILAAAGLVGCAESGVVDATATRAATGVPPEIPGDGLDEDGDGWADEYGRGVSASTLPLLVGDYISVDAAESAGAGWVVGGIEDRGVDHAPAIFSASEGLYWPPDGVLSTPGDARFGRDVAILDDGYVAVTAAASEEGRGFDVYDLPPTAQLGGFDDASGTLGDGLAAADVDADGLRELLASDGRDTRLFHPPWPAPVPAGAWLGAGLDPGGAVDVDGDGVPEILLGDGATAWLAPPDPIGDEPVDERGAPIRGAAGEEIAAPVGLGDVDGDGLADVAVADDSGRGAIWLLARPGASATTDQAFATVAGVFDGERCAPIHRLADAIAVGCPGDGLPGRVGRFETGALSGQISMDDADATWVGLSPGDGFGAALAGDVDVTGDDRPDLAILGGGLAILYTD